VGLNPNEDYRENAGRAVYVTGSIDQKLVDGLTPTINSLRHSSSDPITLYIDSRGGTIHCAEVIRRLITAPNQDGAHCRLITVVTGLAASAAADLLALGDYAIAYPHAHILYHGSRQDFTVCLCRLLQASDYALMSEEAYWLGLVDEVPGAALPNVREMLERGPKAQ